jgi:hypothetical protein
MTIVKFIRALVRLCGVVSCVTLAGLIVARAELGGREIVDNATYPTTNTKGNGRLAKSGVIHLFQSSEHNGEYGARMRSMSNTNKADARFHHYDRQQIMRRQQCD